MNYLNLHNTKAWALLREQKFLYKIIHPLKNYFDELIDPYLIENYRCKLENSLKSVPIPPSYLRRITCGPRLDSYFISGKRIYESLINSLKYLEKDITEFTDILDFGVGAGRVFCQFSKHENLSISGCDPDKRQVQWMSANYPNSYFQNSTFTPPLSFNDETFDLIYSVSVFTHLSESVQFEWLQELNRILKKGGVVLLTVLGEHAAKHNDYLKGTKDLESIIAKKFIFSVSPLEKGLNKFINPTATSQEEMYGYTYHSKEYILQHWSKYFEVKLVESGCIDGLQDLVVLQKSF